MTTEEKIKIRTEKIIKDYGGDVYLIARYGAMFSILFENDKRCKEAILEQASEEISKMVRDKKAVFDCDMCGAVPCGMGCHEEEVK